MKGASFLCLLIEHLVKSPGEFFFMNSIVLNSLDPILTPYLRHTIPQFLYSNAFILWHIYICPTHEWYKSWWNNFCTSNVYASLTVVFHTYALCLVKYIVTKFLSWSVFLIQLKQVMAWIILVPQMHNLQYHQLYKLGKLVQHELVSFYLILVILNCTSISYFFYFSSNLTVLTSNSSLPPPKNAQKKLIPAKILLIWANFLLWICLLFSDIQKWKYAFLFLEQSQLWCLKLLYVMVYHILSLIIFFFNCGNNVIRCEEIFIMSTFFLKFVWYLSALASFSTYVTSPPLLLQ